MGWGGLAAGRGRMARKIHHEGTEGPRRAGAWAAPVFVALRAERNKRHCHMTFHQLVPPNGFAHFVASWRICLPSLAGPAQAAI
jgi:hypothetical protein